MANLRWWHEDKPHASLMRVVRKIQDDQSDLNERTFTSLCLYDDWQALPFAFGGYELQRTEVEGHFAVNAVRSCVDTVRVETIQARPRPLFLTSGGDWTLRRKGQKMGKFVEGVFNECAFDRLASSVVLDALTSPWGCVQIVQDEFTGRAALRRILPGELWVDRRDGHYGAPRSVYLTRWVDRTVLQELYPKHANEIETARDELNLQWQWSDSESDLVCVVEAWHLPSGPNAKDGRHVVVCSACTLDEEAWTAQSFPFAFLRWKTPTSGFHARSLADELRKIQRALNVAAADIEDGQELHAHTKIWLPLNSKVNKGHFTGDAGRFIEGAVKPEPIVFPAVSPEVYRWFDRLLELAYQMSGVAVAAARSEKPAGTTSGRAIRLTADLQSKRFLDFARAYEQFYIDVSREIVRLMERLSEEDSSYDVAYQGKGHAERIAWNDVRIDESSYILQTWPTNLLPSTPQGKLDSVVDLVSTGFTERLGIPAEQILKLLDFPDIEAAFGLVTASWDRVEQILEIMLDEGKYLPPEPFYNLSLCLGAAVRHYQQWQIWGVPEERMELLRQWIGDCKALLLAANPPAPPPPPAGGEAPLPPAPEMAA
jgi:hypothetical protein